MNTATAPEACTNRLTVLVTVQFPGDAASVAQARALVTQTLGEDWPALHDVLMMASELASNAVRHTASGAGGMFGVTVSVTGHTVRIEVNDTGSPTVPAIPDGDADLACDGGRGLRIVNALADTWGHDGDEAGRVVWFEITDEPEVLVRHSCTAHGTGPRYGRTGP
jgi:anti-sigma regulatory factor (Ser/Thr protein kinase)